MQTNTKDWPRIATYIALTAALIGATADVLLLYNPAGGYENNDYRFLLDIAPNRILIGHFLGIFFIPLEMLGLFQVYRALKPAGKPLAWTVVISALYLGFPGVVYHGSVSYVGALLRGVQENPGLAGEWEYTRLLVDPLAAVLPLGFVVMTVVLIYTILKKPTNYARWMAWCTPLSFYVLFLVSYLVVPAVGSVLIPAGFNLAFFFFFLFSLKAEKS